MTTTAGFWTGSISYTDAFGNVNAINLGQVDSDGIFWYWLSISGWDGPDTAGSVVQRTSDHGGWPTPQYFAPRQISWTVFAQAPNQATRDLARQKFQSALPVSDLALFTYNEPVPKQAYVRRQGALVETALTLSEVSFTATMVAPDPRKYKTTLRTFTVNALTTSSVGVTWPLTYPLDTPDGLPDGNQATLPNSGNIATRPVIKVYGPCNSPTLMSTATGQTVSFTGLQLLSAADVLTIDFSNRTATRNGFTALADVTSAWWEIPPGGTDVVYGGIFTVASMAVISYRDAYI